METTSSNPAPLALRRRVAMVFQRPLLLNASVRENVAFGLKTRGERETAACVNEALARLGLLDFERVNARTLSAAKRNVSRLHARSFCNLTCYCSTNPPPTLTRTMLV